MHKYLKKYIIRVISQSIYYLKEKHIILYQYSFFLNKNISNKNLLLTIIRK